MHRYLSADITCSKMRVVFRVRSARKTVSLKEHIMSINKFESIFLRKIEAIVFITSQLFSARVKKWLRTGYCLLHGMFPFLCPLVRRY